MSQWFDPQQLMKLVDQLSTVQLAVFCSAALIGAAWFGILFLKPLSGDGCRGTATQMKW